MVIERVCCNARIDLRSRRPFHGIAMRPFVSARTDMSLLDSGSICNACRMLYLNWRNNTEFISVLNRKRQMNEQWTPMITYDYVVIQLSLPIECSLSMMMRIVNL